MNTNSNSPLLAALLADARVGTFTGLITKKKGKMVGKGADRKLYGDEQVHVVVVTGFRYDRLVQRSLDALPGIAADVIVADLAEKGHKVTVADVEEARAELKASFEKSLAGENESTTAHVYTPLVVNGETVRGSKVYKCVKGESDSEGTSYDCKCRNCTGDEKAPLPGTVYLQGLQIYKTVLTPAPNGDAPEPNSAPKTRAKDALKYKLPVGKYVSYPLEPGADFILNAGGTAAVAASKAGFLVTDDIMNVIAKAA